MENILKQWGVPPLKRATDTLILTTNQNEVRSTLGLVQNLKAGQYHTKFCLIEQQTQRPIFVMEFKEQAGPASARWQQAPHRLKLNLLAVLDPCYRNQGIASYYLSQLKDHALKREIPEIALCPNAKDEVFEELSLEQSLSNSQLRLFYQKRLANQIRVHFFECAN